MSKAKETARHYLLNEHKSPLNQVLHQADLKTELQYHTDIENACKYGYHQAEKDLELTYNDICEIMEIREDVLETDSYENLYEEILKRFKERRMNYDKRTST